MSNPQSWRDVRLCPCRSCRALEEIYTACRQRGEILFVFDCRMHAQPRPWVVANIEGVFIAPAREQDKYATKEEAVAAVLRVQKHCDVYESSWPMKPAGYRDFLWSREVAA